MDKGKHATIYLNSDKSRLFKHYEEPKFVHNEFFALQFLENNCHYNLSPKKESDNSLSVNYLTLQHPSKVLNKYFVDTLCKHLKIIHLTSHQHFGLFLNHCDLFEDNIFITAENNIITIDWGLSRLDSSVYLDLSSLLLGLFNSNTNWFDYFVSSYFGHKKFVDFSKLRYHLYILYEDYTSVRKNNKIETNSLDFRLKKALNVINLSSEKKVCL